MAKRKPAAKPVSKDNAPKTPLDAMLEAGSKLGIDGNAADEPMRTVNQEYKPATGEPVSSANPKTDKNNQTETQSTQDANQTPQSTEQDSEKNRGDVALEPASADSVPWPKSLESVPRARLTSEKRHAYWERMRKAARLAGLPRGQGPGSAYVWATEQAELEFPYVVPEIVEELPAEVESPAPEMSPIGDKPVPEPVSAPIQADGSVSGLSNFPPDWPKLPANAQLQQEIAWVTANRLLVRDGSGVNLSRAMSPPPSYSALSWLETSILFPAKFADISVKATAENDDEKEFIKRERFAIEEIRSILKEMMDAKG